MDFLQKIALALFGIFVFWMVFVVCCIMWHGFGYVGSFGGFKLDAGILSMMMVSGIVMLGAGVFLLKK